MKNFYKIGLIIFFLIFQIFIVVGCNQKSTDKTIPFYLGATEKHSADYTLTDDQKEFAKYFINTIFRGNYEEYKALFINSNEAYIKNQFWNDVQKNKIIKDDDFWFVALDADTMNFVYPNPETIYDMVYFKKINGAWKIQSSEIKAD